MNYKLIAINIGDTLFGEGKGGVFNPSGSKPMEGVASVVSLFLKISFVAAGLVLLFFFILGGIGMISSAGQSDPQKAEQSKKTLTSALIGFIVVFTSYWIVKLIGQLLGIQSII